MVKKDNMLENTEGTKEEKGKEEVLEKNIDNNDIPKAILPDEEYAAKVAEEDPEELERARSEVMKLVRLKGANIGVATIAQQIQPMVYSMSLADCRSMKKALSDNGILGLYHMVQKHNKEEKKKNK